MSHLDIIKAWKDPEYRMGLSEAQRALMPEHPAGMLELTDAQLAEASGGHHPRTCTCLTTTCKPK